MIEVALNLPTGCNSEYVGWDGSKAWNHLVKTAKLAEELGFDEIAVSDHLLPSPGAMKAPVFECWATVTAVAMLTRRVMIGQLVQCASFRSPAIVAKIAATIDVMSSGRVRFGIGAGWFATEHEAFDVDFLSARERVARMVEAVEIVRALWTRDQVSFDGEYFRVRDATCDPKPLQDGGPRIMIAGGGARYTLPVVARLADAANLTGSPEQFAERSAVLDDRCREVGRDPATLERTWAGVALVRENLAAARSAWSGVAGGYERLMKAGRGAASSAEEEMRGSPQDDDAFADFRSHTLIGGPEDVVARMNEYIDHGVTRFYISLGNDPSLETVQRLGEQVLPRISRRATR
jgi:F420-dependent oxidoreductase-like protein